MGIMEKIKLMLVDDNQGLREQLKWALIDTYEIVEADSMETCCAMFERHVPQIVCLDMGLDNIPDRGLEIIDRLIVKKRSVKIIVITANTDENLGPESIKRGAFDFLSKPIDIGQLRIIIERACRINDFEKKDDYSLTSKGLESTEEFLMVGKSEPMLRVFEYIRKLGQNNVNVLITGESGTGKELCARAIHYHSNRRDNMFVPINCGAIPENLIESELFGYVRGAFTGANTNKTGLIESADKGTLLLDEIGDMPTNLQVKLLRFLEDQKIQRIGDTTYRSVDVRVIAATNKKNFNTETEKGNGLRSDLYYRLNEFRIDLPSLKERSDDIPLISKYFIEKNQIRFSMPMLKLSPRAEKVLFMYSWPGNIRELENKLNRAAITCVNQTIEPEDLELAESSLSGSSLKEARDMFEKEFIIRALKKTDYNISDTAKYVGISRPTLYDLLKKHDIQLHIEKSIE
jgi:two-component system, NtrC family, response regulator